MPEAKGKENVAPSSPKGGRENGSYPDSPNINGSSKRPKGKLTSAKVRLLDGTDWDCQLEVLQNIFLITVVKYYIFILV